MGCQCVCTSTHLPRAVLACCRGGPLPLSCRQLTLQVGLVKVTGASQLLLQVAAAAQPLLQPVVQQQLRPSGLQQQRPQQQAQASAAGSDACAAGSRQSVRLPAAVIKAVTLLPDKVSMRPSASSQLYHVTSTASFVVLLELVVSCW